MIRWLARLGAAALAFGSAAGPFSAQVTPSEITLTPGLIIERSVTIKSGRYQLEASADLTKPAVIVRGDNITIDFKGAQLAGGPDGADPDTYKGVGILIEGGSKVTIRNAVVRGYKIGILARKSPDLHLTRNDLSYNWKQRLYSGIEKESLVDWMSYHQNEKDEWLRFGAGIYLTDCDRAELDHNTIVQGQNGLMVTRSSGLRIWNNTIQFLSSIGVGLYRVTGSIIQHNRIDWCVRGYSHAYYNRGQDSAGLLMYQHRENTVAYNSITHSGDGLFLWAGQSTMDTGQGGANDNLFYQNDFSHAPTNGIEATFSRNEFYGNRVEDCWHGVWGGYSYDSTWMDNRFARNAEAIAIEHGQNNTIAGNTFDGDGTGVRLWQNASQDPNWGYSKYRDTRSRRYRIGGNTFRRNKIAVTVRDSSDVELLPNRFEDVGEILALAGETPNVRIEPPPKSPVIDFGSLRGVSKLPGGMDPMLLPDARRGREFIIVDEWGPYDWQHPKLWPVLEADGTRPLPYSPAPGPTPTVRNSRLRVLGPAGSWTLASVRGATVNASSGQIGDVLSVTPASESGLIDWNIDLDYRGESVRSPRGGWTHSGSTYRFSYSRFVLPIAWDVRFFEYTDSSEPVKAPDAFAKLLAGTPLRTSKVDRLDYLSGRPLEDGLPRDRFAVLADGIAELPAGEYTLQVIADDGARVWVDGELVIDAWAPHESRVDTARIGGGKHRLRVEYYEIGSFAELRLDIQPVRRASR